MAGVRPGATAAEAKAAGPGRVTNAHSLAPMGPSHPNSSARRRSSARHPVYATSGLRTVRPANRLKSRSADQSSPTP